MVGRDNPSISYPKKEAREMAHKWTLSRRAFLQLSAAAAAGTIAAACQPQTVIVEKEKIVKETVEVEKEKVVKETVIVAGTPQVVEKVVKETVEVSLVSERQAPTLQEMVKAGTLPAYEERVSLQPLVVEPTEEIGQYGGTWRSALRGTADTAWNYRAVGYETLIRWDLEWTKAVPGVAKSWEVADKGKTFTFYLREGMNWSDGEPFNADDIMFWYEDVASNTDVSPTFPSTWTAGGKPVVVEKVDDYTVRFTYQEPHGLFMTHLPTPSGELYDPRHYLEQFHAKYANKDELDKKVKDAGFGEWYELFGNLRNEWTNTDFPSLYGWVVKTPLGDAPQNTYERNPYYWKVDTAGNQLPYLDEQFLKVYEDVDTILLDAIAGNLDYYARHISSVANLPLLKENEAKGDYHLVKDLNAGGNGVDISFNLTHKNPALRTIFQNDDFRKAMSTAIDRQEIINIVFRGQGEPRQLAPLQGTPWYSEQLEKGWTEYDPDKANQMLDAIMPNKDAEGFRLGADGKRFSVTHEVIAGDQPKVDSLEMVLKYWSDVGVEVILKPEDRSLLYDRKAANEHDITTGTGMGGQVVTDLIDPRFYLPFSAESIHMEGWVQWYATGGKEGEEPIPDVKRCIELYNEVVKTADSEKQAELMTEIININAEHLYCLGITAGAPWNPSLVKNNFHNVPEEMWGSWQYPNPGPANPCQFFIVQQ
jgi:peptide/nickel transport system substrate-binding protein